MRGEDCEILSIDEVEGFEGLMQVGEGDGGTMAVILAWLSDADFFDGRVVLFVQLEVGVDTRSSFQDEVTIHPVVVPTRL